MIIMGEAIPSTEHLSDIASGTVGGPLVVTWCYGRADSDCFQQAPEGCSLGTDASTVAAERVLQRQCHRPVRRGAGR